MITKYSTLHEYLLYWNSSAGTPGASERVRIQNNTYIVRDMIPSVGTVLLCNYSVSTVKQLRRSLVSERRSESMQFVILRIFRQAMIYAEKQGYILDACYDRFFLPPDLDKKVRIYTPGEIRAILEALSTELLYNYYRLIYYTCISSAEARALHISDINLEEGIIHIRYRMSGNSLKEMKIHRINDAQSRRDICLTPPAREAIVDELRRREEKKTGLRWTEPDHDILFVNTTGTPITDSGSTCARKVVKAITGIDGFRVISLRYSAAEAAILAGSTDKVIQDILGFTSMKTVSRMRNRMHREENEL